ncbi:hypothetical protein MBLNU457_4034t1 [Dothideomycetes sp. NU457]
MPDSRDRQLSDRNRSHRSRSPRREHHHKSHRRRSKSPRRQPDHLPLGARPLSKHDLDSYRGLLALYLDLQKHLDIDELSIDEVKGRWKSFYGKWNRGELAEGYYDPVTKAKAVRSANGSSAPRAQQEPVSAVPTKTSESDDEDDDDYGPSLPDAVAVHKSQGPRVPTLEDIQDRREQALEDEEARREDMRYERKQDRKQQKERLEELVPRAEPGSRERQLEKKQEKTAANRAFREARSPGAEDVGEKDLLGDDESYKAQLRANEKKKSERELRKEETLRARAAEREERLAEHRAKEAKTMDMLKAMAKQRFG